MRNFLFLLTIAAIATSTWASSLQLLSSTSDLSVGSQYTFGSEKSGKSLFMSRTSNVNNRKATDSIVVTDGKCCLQDTVLLFTLGGSEGAWTFATSNYAGTAGYLNAMSTTSKNFLQVVSEEDQYARFDIAFSGDTAIVTCIGKSSRNVLQYNTSGLFACYESNTQEPVYLYKVVEDGPEVKYYAKNAWEGTEWTWKEMVKVGDLYKLDNVVFGGVGFNFNTSAIDEGSSWVAITNTEKFTGDAIQAKDTIDVSYNPANGIVTVTLVGRPHSPVVSRDTTIYIAGTFTNWAKGMKEIPYAFEVEKDSTIAFKIVQVIATYEDKCLQSLDTIWLGAAAADTYVTRGANVLSLTDGSNIKLTADVSGEYSFNFNDGVLSVTFPEKSIQVFAKNRWDGSEWTWKEMKKVGDLYQLEKVVFGGVGFNFNTSASDAGSIWISTANTEKFIGDSIQAKDTINVTFSLVDTIVQVQLVGRPYEHLVTYDTILYVAGSFTDWATGMQELPAVITFEKDSTIEFKLVRVIETLEDDSVVKRDLTWYGSSNEGSYMTRGNSKWLLDGGYNVLLTTDAAGEYSFDVDTATGEFVVAFPIITPTSVKNALEKNIMNAQKVMCEGQVFILKGGKTYNLLGEEVE